MTAMVYSAMEFSFPIVAGAGLSPKGDRGKDSKGGGMKGEIIRQAQQAVLEGGKPARAVAEAIGKPYSTLLRELNPFDAQAKLGAETLLEIMRVTDNVDPLRTMAKALGFELVGVCLPARATRSRRSRLDGERDRASKPV